MNPHLEMLVGCKTPGALSHRLGLSDGQQEAPAWPGRPRLSFGQVGFLAPRRSSLGQVPGTWWKVRLSRDRQQWCHPQRAPGAHGQLTTSSLSPSSSALSTLPPRHPLLSSVSSPTTPHCFTCAHVTSAIPQLPRVPSPPRCSFSPTHLTVHAHVLPCVSGPRACWASSVPATLPYVVHGPSGPAAHHGWGPHLSCVGASPHGMSRCC